MYLVYTVYRKFLYIKIFIMINLIIEIGLYLLGFLIVMNFIELLVDKIINKYYNRLESNINKKNNHDV